MQIKGIIFDLDGTLLDTINDIAFCTNTVLERRGFQTYAVERYNDFVGKGLDWLFEKALKSENLVVKKSIIDEMSIEFEDLYHKNWHRKTQPYKGIIEMLNSLKEKNIKMAILSNKPDKFTKIMVEYFFQNYDFIDIKGASDEFPLKPHPITTNQIIKKMKLTPEEIIFVGDSDVDMQTGLNSKCIPIGVEWGFRSVEELEENGATAILQKPAEIFCYLGVSER